MSYRDQFGVALTAGDPAALHHYDAAVANCHAHARPEQLEDCVGY